MVKSQSVKVLNAAYHDEHAIPCSNCGRVGGFDNKRCDHCGYDIAYSEQVWHCIRRLYFPHFHSAAQICKQPTMVPDEKGLFAWYFDWALEELLETQGQPYSKHIRAYDYAVTREYRLCFVGASDQSLRQTIIGSHLGQDEQLGTVKQCELRCCVGALLTKDPVFARKFMTDGKIVPDKLEEQITDFLTRFCQVAFWPEVNPEQSVELYFKEFGAILPLNVQGNEADNLLADSLKEVCKTVL